jgi:hypothetical protein
MSIAGAPNFRRLEKRQTEKWLRQSAVGAGPRGNLTEKEIQIFKERLHVKNELRRKY